eukprot:TRINITY_DN1997_c0_g1_i1.p1 TRINITY_DN1997_c0_g1~~TRINITY_DN1997_c0_g1_i1.p1  ORF type:complete len:622 (+),score=87.49 TRINITY_DN1997_c0_g1_i1:88-1953(+)
MDPKLFQSVLIELLGNQNQIPQCNDAITTLRATCITFGTLYGILSELGCQQIRHCRQQSQYFGLSLTHSSLPTDLTLLYHPSCACRGANPDNDHILTTAVLIWHGCTNVPAIAERLQLFRFPGLLDHEPACASGFTAVQRLFTRAVSHPSPSTASDADDETHIHRLRADFVTAGHIVAQTFLTRSDARLKRDIRLLDFDVVEKLSRIGAYVYRYKEELAVADNKERIGLLAQQVQREFKQAVVEGDDGFLAVDYTQLVPVLVQAASTFDRRLAVLEAGSELPPRKSFVKRDCPVVQPNWLQMPETGQTLQLLQAQRFVLLHGPSGVGKTSVGASVAHKWHGDVSWLVAPEQPARWKRVLRMSSSVNYLQLLQTRIGEVDAPRLIVFDDVPLSAAGDIQDLVTTHPQWHVLMITTDDRVTRATAATALRVRELNGVTATWVLLSHTWKMLSPLAGAQVSSTDLFDQLSQKGVDLPEVTRDVILSVVDLCEGLMIALALAGDLMFNRNNTTGLSLVACNSWRNLRLELASSNAKGKSGGRYVVLSKAITASLNLMHDANKEAALQLSVFDSPDIAVAHLNAVWGDGASERLHDLCQYGIITRNSDSSRGTANECGFISLCYLH